MKSIQARHPKVSGFSFGYIRIGVCANAPKTTVPVGRVRIATYHGIK
jgi:hypothetical protein